MAQTILYHVPALQSSTAQSQYKLPESDRQKILAGSDSARQARFIEKQREDFIQKNGNDGVTFPQ